MARVNVFLACLIGVWSLQLLRVSSAQTDVKAWTRGDGESTTVNCSALSPPVNTKFWEAMDRCYDCAAEPSCGFCRSTMTCVAGNVQGPYQQFQIWCSDWIPEAEACPVNPQCNTITDCEACAGSNECVWCASDASCMAVEEGYGSGCKALVSETPCPKVVVPETIIVGDVIINQEPPNVRKGIVVLGVTRFNMAGGEVTIAAGDGLHQNRGRGGVVKISGGKGEGLQNSDDSVTGGGNVVLEGGNATGGIGGMVKIRSGFSNSGVSGDVTVATGPGSTFGNSGNIGLNGGEAIVGNGGGIVLRGGPSVSGSGGQLSFVSGASTAVVPLHVVCPELYPLRLEKLLTTLREMCKFDQGLRREAFPVASALTAVTQLLTVVLVVAFSLLEDLVYLLMAGVVVRFVLLEAMPTDFTPWLKETVVELNLSEGHQ
ncbi:hypothetical protein BBJ29_003325 [Phytophthora kernoviae]|uniref:PSI domain-containing protein n=1 Tax=Phytophthora kernoviae TaxID=325452 RepID=A0A3F2RM92_9STRA|nr:hypothetical protein BBJ29_003325 [Phytophthora kernoviae]RLN60409.1 hypothetical protein BBP00_00005997 [Phytophthora kernoviae]